MKNPPNVWLAVITYSYIIEHVQLDNKSEQTEADFGNFSGGSIEYLYF